MAFMDNGKWGFIPYKKYQEKPSKATGNWKRDGNQFWWHDDRSGKDHYLNWAEDKMEGRDDGCYDMTRVS
jgi:hypothetical protein